MISVFASTGDGLSSMWRIEILHPMLVHFPIALVLVGTGFRLVSLPSLRWRWSAASAFAARVLLVIAAVSAWAAVQSGFWADSVVGRELYDPRLLKDHENSALTFSWLLSVIVLIDLASCWRRVPERVRRYGWFAVTLGLAIGCWMIAYSAHLGAGLVYQQGAGVQMPEMNLEE